MSDPAETQLKIVELLLKQRDEARARLAGESLRADEAVREVASLRKEMLTLKERVKQALNQVALSAPNHIITRILKGTKK